MEKSTVAIIVGVVVSIALFFLSLAPDQNWRTDKAYAGDRPVYFNGEGPYQVIINDRSSAGVFRWNDRNFETVVRLEPFKGFADSIPTPFSFSAFSWKNKGFNEFHIRYNCWGDYNRFYENKRDDWKMDGKRLVFRSHLDHLEKIRDFVGETAKFYRRDEFLVSP